MSNFEKFGDYILLEKLASGGMAEVYLAKNEGADGVNKFLALKRILPQFSENQDFINMFKEEAKIAVNLNNSNVVSIFDFGVQHKQFYLVMDYVEGKNLRQILNDLKKKSLYLSTDQIVFIVKEVAAGLDHAHRCINSATGKPLNITHRDMSPQNVMISYDGEVKVIDFGIAKAETQMEGTQAGTLKGKYGYMSPEQADGQPVDLQTDVFSLGIVLWELLANDRLFTASSEAAILRKVRDCQIQPIRKINPSVHPDLDKIVAKALAKDKNQRYQTAAAFHKDLNRFLNLQYPDFNPKDFSIFIKNTFSESYQESRTKLVGYSKVQPHQQNQSLSAKPEMPKTKVPSPGAHAKTVIENPGHISHDDVQKTVIEDSGQDKIAKVDLSGIRSAKADKTKLTSNTHTFSKSGGTHTGIKNSAGAHTRITKKGPSISLDAILSFAIQGVLVAIVVIGGYWFWNNQKSPVGKSASIAPPETHGQAEAASKAIMQISIQSNPPGARIYIDGADTGALTPSIRSVEANKTIHLTLKKEGFLSYEKEIQVDSDASTTVATLQPAPSAGYISINLVNGGDNPIIHVNGMRLGEKPPISKYAIPANIPIVITAKNPLTGAYAEKKFRIQPNQKEDLELILQISR